jgi:Uma2 family endonuclease
MTPALAPAKSISEDEYFARLEASLHKLEYFNGEIVAMAGAAPNHVRIEANLTNHTVGQLRGSTCESFGSNLAVRAAQANAYCFPDLTIVCGEQKFAKRRHLQCLENPLVIFEVLSPSTESVDRRQKLTMYSDIKSLRDYVLISTDHTFVEHFQRKSPSELWQLRFHTGLDERLEIPKCHLAMTLAQIYERVVFEAS